MLQVEIEDGCVKIKTTKQDLEVKKRIKKMACCSPDDDTVYLIIGGGKSLQSLCMTVYCYQSFNLVMLMP